MALPHRVVLFDGHCNLCNGAVDFIIRRDPKGRFRFASLQSDAARELLAARGLEAPELDGGAQDTVLLVTPHAVYDRSTAALRVARRLSGAWPLAFWLLMPLPRALRDAVYRWVARHRLRWFGRRETCRMPSPEEAARFL
jgi:predicted DCC family thiol-disulfide oxidoreductase YuxK